MAVSIAGAAGTVGIAQTGFPGGMLHNGFLAATIGGLADWFAVTALFRKPLGISYRTEIIVRNRQRIMQAVVDFAANDLLGTDNIMKFVRQQDLSRLLREFIQRHGQEKVLPYAETIGAVLAEELEPERVSALLAPAVHQLLGREVFEKAAADMLRGFSEEGSSRQLLHILSAGAEELLRNQELKQLLSRHIDAVLQEYAQAASSRAFVMGMLGISGEKAADALWKKGGKWLAEVSENPAAEAEAAEWLGERLQELAASASVRAGLADILARECTQERVAGLLDAALRQWLEQGVFVQQLKAWLEEAMTGFLTNEEWQKKADIGLKLWLETELRRHHGVIAGMIEERLGSLSDAELVRFTEEKVADDLQMIRINGSVVGALVGMGLYAIVHIAGQVLTP